MFTPRSARAAAGHNRYRIIGHVSRAELVIPFLSITDARRDCNLHFITRSRREGEDGTFIIGLLWRRAGVVARGVHLPSRLAGWELLFAASGGCPTFRVSMLYTCNGRPGGRGPAGEKVRPDGGCETATPGKVSVGSVFAI